MLVFAVLCLSIFALLSLATANADKAAADAEAALVAGYYEADALAEHVLNGILGAEDAPDVVLGVAVGYEWDAGVDIAEFLCPITDQKELYVKVALYEDSYDVLIWRMRDTGAWEPDAALPVWQGD